MHYLPPLPPAVTPLANADSAMLASLHPAMATIDKCLTCGGSETFRWWDHYSEAPVLRNFDDDFGDVTLSTATREPEVVEYQCPRDDDLDRGCTGQWLLHRYLLFRGVGLRYQRASWEDCVAESGAVEVVQDWSRHAEWNVRNGVGIVLHGGMGTGKTLLASLLLKDLIANKGYDGHLVSFTDMISSLTASWRSTEERTWFMRRIKNVDVLLIDDIGREVRQNKAAGNPGEKVSSRLAEAAFDEVLRHRISASRPTFITTNLGWDDLRGYGPNVMSLLQEASVDYHFVGDDFRGGGGTGKRVEMERRLNLTRPVVIG